MHGLGGREVDKVIGLVRKHLRYDRKRARKPGGYRNPKPTTKLWRLQQQQQMWTNVLVTVGHVSDGKWGRKGSEISSLVVTYHSSVFPKPTGASPSDRQWLVEHVLLWANFVKKPNVVCCAVPSVHVLCFACRGGGEVSRHVRKRRRQRHQSNAARPALRAQAIAQTHALCCCHRNSCNNCWAKTIKLIVLARTKALWYGSEEFSGLNIVKCVHGGFVF